MTDLHRKVSALLDASLKRDVLVDLLIDVIARGLGRLGGRPRNHSLPHVIDDVSEPVSKPGETHDLSSDLDPDSGSPDPSKQISVKGGSDGPADFLTFWAAYPRKVAKADARRAWLRRRPPIDLCIATLEWQRESKQWREGIVPHPATWINGGRWEDPRPASSGPTGRPELRPVKIDRFVPKEAWPEKGE